MKIAMLSKADAWGGGASKVAVELTAALREQGVEVRHHVGWGGRQRLRDGYGPHVEPVFGRSRAVRVAVKLALAAQWKLSIPELLPVEGARVRASGVLDADLIHVHDITELMSARTLLQLSLARPVVWTLHDSSPFTAGCIQPFDGEPLGCRRWRQESGGCDRSCPMHAQRMHPFAGWTNAVFNGVPLLYAAKARLAREGRLVLTSPSSWLAGEVAASRLYAGRSVSVIFNGIDVDAAFVPRPKSDARAALGLPADRPVLAMLAGDLNDRNKGFVWGAEAIGRLPAEWAASGLLLAIGRAPTHAPQRIGGMPVRWTGFIDEPARLACHLAAADAMLYPSLADNQPLAVIEAMACGTPVFCFDSGGVAEVVGSGAERGGVAVPRKDAAALAQALQAAVESGALVSLGLAARARAVRCFSRQRMAQDFLGLYRTVLAGAASATAEGRRGE